MDSNHTGRYRSLCFLLIFSVSAVWVCKADSEDKIPSAAEEILKTDPNHIIMPDDREIWITYIYEGTGSISDLGWFLYSDAVDSRQNDNPDDDEFIGWDSLLEKDQTLRREGKKGILHPVFVFIRDDSKDSLWEISNNSRGVLDKTYGDPVMRTGEFPVNEEAKLGDVSQYNDGTGIPFTVDGDGIVSPHDMRKKVGTFAAGTEPVFFLASNHRWHETGKADQTFFSKTAWNPDVYEMKWRYRIDRQTCEAQTACDADFACFDNAANRECIDKCLNKDSACILSCYNDMALADCGNTETECLKYGQCEHKWSVFYRTVPLDSEIAENSGSPGWTDNWKRGDYTYGFQTGYTIQYDKTATYGGKVYRLETEMKFDSVSRAVPAQFSRLYRLGIPGGETWKTDAGWLNADAIQRLNRIFALSFDESDTSLVTFINGEKYPHVLAAVPTGSTELWVMGWKDMPGTLWSDTDCNDLVFRLEFGQLHCGLSHVIQVLRILSGQNTDMPSVPDIAGDGCIGMAEAIYLLQRAAELR